MLKNFRILSKYCGKPSNNNRYLLEFTKYNRNSYGFVNLLNVRTKKDDNSFTTLFKPVSLKKSSDDINIGAELTGKLNKSELLKILNKFSQKKEIKLLCLENGLDSE